MRRRPHPITLQPGGEGRRSKKLNNYEGNAMLGLMQDWPLLMHRIIDHAAAVHGGRVVITRSVEGPIHRACSPTKSSGSSITPPTA